MCIDDSQCAVARHTQEMPATLRFSQLIAVCPDAVLWTICTLLSETPFYGWCSM